MGRSSYPPQLDSPSRQLVLDLTRDLEELRIHNSELKKVKAYERRSFYENLDRIDSELEANHNAALDRVAARHDRVREEAEETLRSHQRAIEEENRRREEEARKEAERLAREKEERLRREREEAAAEEARQRAAAEARKKAEEEAKRKQEAELAEKEKEKERLAEENRRRQEEQKKAELERVEQEKAQKAQAAQQKRLGGGRVSEEEVKIQARYLEVHRELKTLRQRMRDESKQNPLIKQNLGEIRRTIKKCVGQLREGKGTNKTQIQEIRNTLEKAASIPEPRVNVCNYLAFPPPEIASSGDTQVPALLIYGLNIFAKSLIAALLTEASLNHGHSEPVGIVAAQIFSMDAFIYKGCPMVDILWAKYRVVCPALWGFYGDEKTEGGRRALAWWREGPDGPYISEQGHADRMTALGAGFASITLRNFGKTPRKNPFPNHLFWFAMHKILTVPVDEMQETHVILLSSMLKSSAERIVGFFGHIGLALMRRAIVDLPSALPRQSMGVNQLKLLKDLYKREKNIII
ncbi:hypothetical protein BDV59DRAFT_201359 [Aspergillus ambiguus]|uniref:putative RNA export mediator Gle1 n=1 Tax=Aspergillus ambiguus TaxID=176160 RepID=UPI003CCD1FB2